MLRTVYFNTNAILKSINPNLKKKRFAFFSVSTPKKNHLTNSVVKKTLKVLDHVSFFFIYLCDPNFRFRYKVSNPCWDFDIGLRIPNGRIFTAAPLMIIYRGKYSPSAHVSCEFPKPEKMKIMINSKWKFWPLYLERGLFSCVPFSSKFRSCIVGNLAVIGKF